MAPVGVRPRDEARLVDVAWLRQGSMMELLMASKPDAMFGRDESDRPHSTWDAPGFVAILPSTPPGRFNRTARHGVCPGALRPTGVRLDEGVHWFQCQGTQWTDETVSLLARAIVDGDTSRTVRHRILHVDHDWTLTLENLPDNQYMAGGLTALIDGIDGGNDFRTGEWQGYWGTDMVARIDLGAVEEDVHFVGGCKTSNPGFGCLNV